MYLELKLELNYQVMRFLKEEEIIIKKEEKLFLFNFMTNKIKKTIDKDEAKIYTKHVNKIAE